MLSETSQSQKDKCAHFSLSEIIQKSQTYDGWGWRGDESGCPMAVKSHLCKVNKLSRYDV